VWLTQSHKGIMPSPYGTSSHFLFPGHDLLRSLPPITHSCVLVFFPFCAIWRHHSTLRLPNRSSSFQRAFFLRDSLPEFVFELLSIILTTRPAQYNHLTCIYQSNVFIPPVHNFVVP
jgi:hypothetical protein